MSDFAKRQRAAATRAARYVRAQSKASRMISLPRRVTAACSHRGQKVVPHYLVYLTQEEIALVLALTAHSPSGVTGPKGVLCANTEGPEGPRKRAKIVIDSDSDEDVEVEVEEQSGPPGFDQEDYNTWGWKAAPVEEGDDNGLIDARVYYKDDDAMGTITHYLPQGWDGDKETQRVWYYRLDGEEDEAVGFEFEERMLWESDKNDMKELQRVLNAAKNKKKGYFNMGPRSMFGVGGERREAGNTQKLHGTHVAQRRPGSSSRKHRGLAKGDGDPFSSGDYVYYAYPEEDPDTGETTFTWHAALVHKAEATDDPDFKRYQGGALVAADQIVTLVPIKDATSWTKKDRDNRAKPAKVEINDVDFEGFTASPMTTDESGKVLTYLRIFTNDMSGTDEVPAGFAIKHMEPAPDKPGKGYLPELLGKKVGEATVDCAAVEAGLEGGVEAHLMRQRIFSKAHLDSGFKTRAPTMVNGRLVPGGERELDDDDRAAGYCVTLRRGSNWVLDRARDEDELNEIRRLREDRAKDSAVVEFDTIADAEGQNRAAVAAMRARKSAKKAREAQLADITAIADAQDKANAMAARAEQQQAQAEAAAAQTAIDEAKGKLQEGVGESVGAVKAAVRAQLSEMGADADAILADFNEADADGEYENDEDRIGALGDLLSIAEVRAIARDTAAEKADEKRQKKEGLFETVVEDNEAEG